MMTKTVLLHSLFTVAALTGSFTKANVSIKDNALNSFLPYKEDQGTNKVYLQATPEPQPLRYGRTRVSVHIPFHLHSPTSWGHMFAEYGTFAASGSIAGAVIEAPHSLCKGIYDTSVLFGDVTNHALITPFFLFINRDHNCSFVTQTRHAQQAGAAAVLLGDTSCQCSDKGCTEEFKDEDCESTLPALVDDGSARADIGIPTILLFKRAAHQIQNVIKEPIMMEVAWGLPEVTQNKTAKESLVVPLVHLWRSARDEFVDLETLENLHTLVEGFGSDIDFEPRYTLFRGDAFGCRDHKRHDSHVNDKKDAHQDDKNPPCDHLCTNHGRYCALHSYDLSGFPIVHETLRQVCLWSISSKTTHEQYWKYLLYHREHCWLPHQYSEESCINAALKHANVTISQVETCMNNSNGVDTDKDNHLLEEVLTHQTRAGAFTKPAMMINEQLIQPQFSTFSLFEYVCYNYWEQASRLMGRNTSQDVTAQHLVPKICLECQHCPDTWTCWRHGHCIDHNDSGHHEKPSPSSGGGHSRRRHRRRRRISIFSWMFFIMLIGGGGYYYYYHVRTPQVGRSRDPFGSEGAGLLTSYFQMT